MARGTSASVLIWFYNKCWGRKKKVENIEEILYNRITTDQEQEISICSIQILVETTRIARCENLECGGSRRHFACGSRTRKKAPQMPACGTKTNPIHAYRTLIVKDIPAFGLNEQIHLRRRRYRCSCGKRFDEKNTWLAKYRRNMPRMTEALIENILI